MVAKTRGRATKLLQVEILEGQKIAHWTTNFYKSHVMGMKLVISYQHLCAEHEYDIQIAKLALVFCNYNLKEINVYIMKSIIMH